MRGGGGKVVTSRVGRCREEQKEKQPQGEVRGREGQKNTTQDLCTVTGAGTKSRGAVGPARATPQARRAGTNLCRPRLLLDRLAHMLALRLLLDGVISPVEGSTRSDKVVHGVGSRGLRRPGQDRTIQQSPRQTRPRRSQHRRIGVTRSESRKVGREAAEREKIGKRGDDQSVRGARDGWPGRGRAPGAVPLGETERAARRDFAPSETRRRRESAGQVVRVEESLAGELGDPSETQSARERVASPGTS